MRACQHCAAPIPTAAKVCSQCGELQADSVGLAAQTDVPAPRDVAEENRERDEQIARYGLMILVSGASLSAVVSGLSLSSVVVGAGVFFIALVLLFLVRSKSFLLPFLREPNIVLR